MTTPALYLLFFLSGISGLIYQVVWVHAFGNVFGNTIYSASLVVAIFMLGLRAGSYIVGLLADRQYARALESLLRAYGLIELAIAAHAAHNDLGVALASMGRIDQAVEHFRRAVVLEPGFEEARNNLRRAGSR